MTHSSSQPCPCQQGASYATCCQPVHQNPQSAIKPVALMQARYSAHVLGLVDFIVNTYHPSCHASEERAQIAESTQSQWQGLEIVQTSDIKDNQGFVEFKAYFSEDGAQYCMHEKSRFVFEDGQWFYIDGEMQAPDAPEVEAEQESLMQMPVQQIKVGRNDPCPCGSGKKFKKCCA